MALPNQSRRFLDLLTRVFNAPEGKVMIGDISPGIALETEDAQELDLPRGWRRYGQVVSGGAVASQSAEIGFDNPAGSKTLIRVEAMAALSATAAGDSCVVGFTSGVNFAATWSDQGAGGVLDTRVRTTGGYQIGAGHFWRRTAAVGTTTSRFTILYPTANNVMTYAARAECKAVLDPGQQMIFSFLTQNIVQRVLLVYAERYFDTWEKFPVQ